MKTYIFASIVSITVISLSITTISRLFMEMNSMADDFTAELFEIQNLNKESAKVLADFQLETEKNGFPLKAKIREYSQSSQPKREKRQVNCPKGAPGLPGPKGVVGGKLGLAKFLLFYFLKFFNKNFFCRAWTPWTERKARNYRLCSNFHSV